MTLHVFDQAIALQALGDGRFSGAASPRAIAVVVDSSRAATIAAALVRPPSLSSQSRVTSSANTWEFVVSAGFELFAAIRSVQVSLSFKPRKAP